MSGKLNTSARGYDRETHHIGKGETHLSRKEL
jgi:hypothetical protein